MIKQLRMERKRRVVKIEPKSTILQESQLEKSVDYAPYGETLREHRNEHKDEKDYDESIFRDLPQQIQRSARLVDPQSNADTYRNR